MVSRDHTRINVTLSKNDLQALEIYCNRYGVSKSRLIRAIITDWLVYIPSSSKSSVIK